MSLCLAAGDWARVGEHLTSKGYGGHFDIILASETIYNVQAQVRMLECLKQVGLLSGVWNSDAKCMATFWPVSWAMSWQDMGQGRLAGRHPVRTEPQLITVGIAK